jgi:hypothetical protein
MSSRLHTPCDAHQRLAILRRWWAIRRTAPKYSLDRSLDRFLLDLKREGRKVSKRTLFYWDQRYLQMGLNGLQDGRGGRRGVFLDAFLDKVAGMYFGRPSIALCYKLALTMASERGWKVSSYRACRRHVARLRSERRDSATSRRS